jgi:hypothetical protein
MPRKDFFGRTLRVSGVKFTGRSVSSTGDRHGVFLAWRGGLRVHLIYCDGSLTLAYPDAAECPHQIRTLSVSPKGTMRAA